MSASKKKQERREASLTDQKLTEKQKREQQEAQAARRNTIIGIIVGVVAVILVAALLIWRSGVIPRHTTALTVKDVKYSVADMDYFYYSALNSTYQQQQYYLQIYQQLGYPTDDLPSFDPTGDLTQQFVDPDAEEPQSYHDYFKESAKAVVTQITALLAAADEEGYTLSEDARKELDEEIANLDKQLVSSNYASRSAYLKAAYGHSMTEKVFLRNMEKNALAQDYYTHKTEGMKNYSDEDLESYYTANPDKLDSYTYNYVFFDGQPEAKTDDNGNTIAATEKEKADAMAEAEKKADELIAAVQAAEAATPAEGEEKKDFAAVAAGFTSNQTLQENILGAKISSTVYGEWLMDSARKDGDLEKLKMEGQGWYVVQYRSRARDDVNPVDVRHILFSTAVENPTPDDSSTADVNEAEVAAEQYSEFVKAKAQKVLDEYLAGEQTAEAFGKLAEANSDDGRGDSGSLSAAGGLYTDVHPGDMVAEFNDWIFDESRKAGDTGLVKTQFGWHVMYYQAKNEPGWKTQAQSDKSSSDQTQWMDSVEEGYEAAEGSGFSQIGR